MTITEQQKVVRFWHALEHLVPFDLRRTISEAKYSCRVETGADSSLPWLNPEILLLKELDVKKRYSYTVYAGVFSVKETTSILRKIFAGPEPDYEEVSAQTSCFGSFMVDSDGALVVGSLSLSTLPWTIGYLSAGDLDAKLNDPFWAEKFGSYKHSILERFLDDAVQLESPRLKLTAAGLRSLLEHMIGKSGWRPEKLEPMAFCVIEEDRKEKAKEGYRQIQPGASQAFSSELKTKSPQEELEQVETEILNSFYIDELERVYRELGRGNAGPALLRYLDERRPAHEINLLDNEKLKEWVSPRRLPRGRWPTEDHHYQSLMQQAAINIALTTLKNDGLFSVNGPPGTGKTTMLRDIIAGLIVERAERLAAVEDPSKAFRYAGQMVDYQDNSRQVFRPPTAITGFEIVIASSNNGAVENVTREIPSSKTVGDNYLADLSYFESVARYVLGRDNRGSGPWGLIAAVLGNSANRSKFAQKFWFEKPDERHHDRVSLNYYLRGIASATLHDWHEAQETFTKAKSRVSELIEQRERWARAAGKRESLYESYKEAEKEDALARERNSKAARALKDLEEETATASKAVEDSESNISIINATRRPSPYWLYSLLSHIFNISEFNQYREKINIAREEHERAFELLTLKRNEYDAARRRLRVCAAQELKAQSDYLAAKGKYEENEEICQQAKGQLGDAFADGNWWRKEEHLLQLYAPWVDTEINRARAELFIAATRLHQLFIELARKEILKNLWLWVDLISGKRPTSTYREHFLYLWQTLFLIVPVVSTTFASFGRMFRDLGRESLGWLLIDEAGQATPQAATGALWRARRAVVVGDPLQIEPVFPVEDSAIDRIREFYGVSEHWRPSGSSRGGKSAQLIADHRNPYGGRIFVGDSSLWVGCPLRVHRRCESPMFEISNEIAYGGLMIKKTKEAEDIDYPLGPSCWVNVTGACDERHWVHEQGREVIRMLHKLAGDSRGLPDVYMISPFRNVARRLEKQLYSSRSEWLSKDVDDQLLRRWLKRSVGTVHTFQGKEAETVILVLGADERSIGAARWASSKPNILNVAATRARQRFYIVGDKNLWGKLPFFETARRLLDKNVESF